MDTKENLTRSYIFKAYIKLLELKHYDKISVCEITEKAGVSRMSFYRNFKSKEDLTFQGIEEIIKNVKNQILKHETKSIYLITKLFFETASEYKPIIPSLDHSEISKQLMTLITSKLKENLQMDYMNKTSKYIPIFYFGAICTTMVDWLKNGAKETPDDMAKMIASLINFDI